MVEICMCFVLTSFTWVNVSDWLHNMIPRHPIMKHINKPSNVIFANFIVSTQEQLHEDLVFSRFDKGNLLYFTDFLKDILKQLCNCRVILASFENCNCAVPCWYWNVIEHLFWYWCIPMFSRLSVSNNLIPSNSRSVVYNWSSDQSIQYVVSSLKSVK